MTLEGPVFGAVQNVEKVGRGLEVGPIFKIRVWIRDGMTLTCFMSKSQEKGRGETFLKQFRR